MTWGCHHVVIYVTVMASYIRRALSSRKQQIFIGSYTGGQKITMISCKDIKKQNKTTKPNKRHDHLKTWNFKPSLPQSDAL